jgi:hypothetical protein
MEESHLFSFEELVGSDFGEVEFRTLDSDSSLRPLKNTDHRFPIEMS